MPDQWASKLGNTDREHLWGHRTVHRRQQRPPPRQQHPLVVLRLWICGFDCG